MFFFLLLLLLLLLLQITLSVNTFWSLVWARCCCLLRLKRSKVV